MIKEILQYSYWEHFKAGKDLALVLGPDHPKVQAIREAANQIQHQIALYECKE